MTQRVIDLGVSPGDGLGDGMRMAFTKANRNFDELYQRIAPLASEEIAGDGIVDWDLSDNFYRTLTANTTISFTNNSDRKVITLALTNTASNYTVTWPGTVYWPDGIGPMMSEGAVTDLYTFVQLGGKVFGFFIQNMS